MTDWSKQITDLEQLLQKAKDELANCRALVAAAKEYPRPHPAGDPNRGRGGLGVNRDSVDPCRSYEQGLKDVRRALEDARRRRQEDAAGQPRNESEASETSETFMDKWRRMEDSMAYDAFTKILRGKSLDDVNRICEGLELRVSERNREILKQCCDRARAAARD